jgi:hypothetical protein
MLIGAMITSFATIMQLWLGMDVMINDYHCHTEFCGGDTSVINKMNCMDSVNNTIKWHCACRYYETVDNVDCWLKYSNTFTTVLATVPLFWPLILIALLREIAMILKIINYSNEIYEYYTTFEYFSILGFITMIFDPTVFNRKIYSDHKEAAIIIMDIVAICLVLQYSDYINVSIMTNPFFLVTLIASCGDALKCIYILYYLDHKYRKMRCNNLLVQSVHIQRYT